MGKVGIGDDGDNHGRERAWCPTLHRISMEMTITHMILALYEVVGPQVGGAEGEALIPI